MAANKEMHCSLFVSRRRCILTPFFSILLSCRGPRRRVRGAPKETLLHSYHVDEKCAANCPNSPNCHACDCVTSFMPPAFVLASAFAVAPGPVCCFKGGWAPKWRGPRIVRRRRRKENGNWGAGARCRVAAGCWGAKDTVPLPQTPVSLWDTKKDIRRTYKSVVA